MAYGMTNQGFIPKRLEEILEDMNENLATITDDAGNFPFQNAKDDSVLQQIIALFANELSECWAQAYEASVQFDPLYNYGAGQSGTVQLNAIERIDGAYTIVEIELEGKEGTVIPLGSKIADSNGENIFTINETVVLGSGVTKSTATAQVKGYQEISANTIITIQSPINGWSSVRNTFTISNGENMETDEELRVRQQRSTYLTSYRLIDSIYSALLNIEGVVFARVYQNAVYNPEDARGIPYKEVAAIVEGGDDTAIAEALFYRFPTAQQGYGSTTVTFLDTQGISYPISFSRPKKVPIYIEIDIKIVDRAYFPDNAADLIKEEIIEYSKYGVSTNDEGFPPGESVIRTRLFTPINKIGGHSILLLRIGKDPAILLEEDIEILWDEVSEFLAENITVNVTS